MRLSLMCALLLAGSAAAEKAKIVVTPLQGSDATMQRIAEALSDSLLTELERTGRVEAIGPGDVTALIGFERQKALLGCGSESESCLAEITSAIGAPWLLTGAVLRMGKTTRVDLKLIRTRDGKVTWRDGMTMKDESEFFDGISAMVKSLVARGDFSSGSGSKATTVVDAGPSAPVAPWLVVGLGAATLIAGAVFTGLAASEWSHVNDDTWRSGQPWTAVQAEAQSFNRDIYLGPALLGAGALVVGVGVVWAVVGKQNPAPVSFGFTGTGVVVGGAF